MLNIINYSIPFIVLLAIFAAIALYVRRNEDAKNKFGMAQIEALKIIGTGFVVSIVVEARKTIESAYIQYMSILVALLFLSVVIFLLKMDKSDFEGTTNEDLQGEIEEIRSMLEEYQSIGIDIEKEDNDKKVNEKADT